MIALRRIAARGSTTAPPVPLDILARTMPCGSIRSSTLDELFEVLTPCRTGKMQKNLGIVLFGTGFWDEVINFEALIEHGTISREDLALFHRTDSVDDAFEFVTRHLTEHALAERGAAL